jgi:hypothetical protein
MPTAFSVAGSPITTAGTLTVTATGTTSQYIRGDGSLATFPGLTGFVPYTGATADVNLGTHDLAAERGTFTNNGSSDALTVNHTSGSGYGIIVTKGGANEALYVSKTSGSGNAMTVVGGRTSLVDLALSSVTNTAGDFLTLSGGVVHKRTAAQTLTDIGGQAALTNPVTGTGTSGQVAYFSGTSAITGDSDLVFDGNNLTLGGNLTAGNKINNEFIFQNNGTFGGGSGAATIINVKYGGQTIALISSTGTDQRDAIFKLLDEGVIKVNIAANNARGGATYFNGGGNVLIGTATDAGFKLDVNGTARFSGVVGIGNTPKTFAGTTLGALQVGTSWVGTFAASSTFGTILGNNVYYNSDWKRTLAQPVSFIQFNEDNIFFTNAATGSADSTFTPITRLAIISAGNVGIGTASPSTGLHLSGTGAFPVLRIARTDTSSIMDLGFGLGDAAGTMFTLIDRTAGVNRLNFTSGGNVLIGRTSDIGGKLQVNGQVKGDNFALYIASAFRGGLYTYNQVFGSGTDYGTGLFSEGEIFLAPGGSATKRMSMTNAGAVTFSNLGTGTVTATAGTLSTVSDLSYKIEDGFIDSAIEKVLNLKPRYFYWNEKSGLPKDIRQLGFYAQEVNEALGEEAANTPQDQNTPWGISDRSIIAMLTKAIQELKQEIDTLKN